MNLAAGSLLCPVHVNDAMSPFRKGLTIPLSSHWLYIPLFIYMKWLQTSEAQWWSGPQQ